MRDDTTKAIVILAGCAIVLVLLVVECFLMPSWGVLWMVVGAIDIIAAAIAIHRLAGSRRR